MICKNKNKASIAFFVHSLRASSCRQNYRPHITFRNWRRWNSCILDWSWSFLPNSQVSPQLDAIVLFACDLQVHIELFVSSSWGFWWTYRFIFSWAWGYPHLAGGAPMWFLPELNAAPNLPAGMDMQRRWTFRRSSHLGWVSFWSCAAGSTRRKEQLWNDAVKVLEQKNILCQPQASASSPVNFAF